MRCSQCGSAMQETDTIVEGRARQTWYQCPVCAASQTVSQPCQTGLQRIGSMLRCSCVWPEASGMQGNPY